MCSSLHYDFALGAMERESTHVTKGKRRGTDLECCNVLLAWNNFHALQPALQVNFLPHFARVSSDADTIE